MSPLVPLLRRCTAALACSLTVAGLQAELIKVSPFLPPQGAANAPTQNAPLEYRGSMEMNDVEQYRVVDPQRKVGTWLKIGERDANLDVVVKQHDTNNDTITIEHGGQTMTLPMKTAKVISAGSAPQIMPTLPPPQQIQNVSPAVLQTVVPNPTPADEARRLEAVAAEVARRRAMREQAAQQVQSGAPAPAAAAGQDYQQQQRSQPPPPPSGIRPGFRQQ